MNPSFKCVITPNVKTIGMKSIKWTVTQRRVIHIVFLRSGKPRVYQGGRRLKKSRRCKAIIRGLSR